MRKDGPTPHGGAYSEIFFFDNDNNFTEDKENAVKAVIRECAEDGTLIFETWMEVR